MRFYYHCLKVVGGSPSFSDTGEINLQALNILMAESISAAKLQDLDYIKKLKHLLLVKVQ